MNPHVERALLLLQQERHELAAQELRLALVDAPNDALAHAVLAICLSANKQYDEAMSGNTTMLVWLGKNELGQTDKNATTIDAKPFKLSYKLDDSDE